MAVGVVVEGTVTVAVITTPVASTSIATIDVMTPASEATLTCRLDVSAELFKVLAAIRVSTTTTGVG